VIPVTTRTNCPHLQNDLVPFHTRFPTIVDGQDISLTSTDKLLLCSCSVNVTLGTITIPSGAVLVINDQPLSLSVREIKVEADGSFLAGSDTCRLFSNIDFIFLGTRNTSSPVIPTGPSKGIISSGRTEIFGKQYHPTFSRLSVSARVNDTIIFLQDRVNWEVGQEILFTTTSFFDCPQEFLGFCKNKSHQNEICTIVAISQTAGFAGYAIKINQPLTFTHYSGPEYAGEVALLSRRIRFLGGNNSSADQFGGHTRIETETGIGKFGGIQADQMGQLNTLGRYPFHFHMLKNTGNTSSIEDCSVTNSFFRAYTIHGTNFSRVARNVGFNIKGFAVYLEDGVEEHNVFEYNLMAHVHPIFRPSVGAGGQSGDPEVERPGLLLNPADISASGYYVSNAHNDFIGNVASGGWSGFAFPNIPKPLGLFLGVNLGSNNNPFNRPTKNFTGNSAHSTGFYWKEHGSGFYVGALLQSINGTLRYDPGRNGRRTVLSNGTSAIMFFHDTKAWAVNKGVAHWGDKVQINRYEAHDFGQQAAMLFGEAGITDAVFNFRTANAVVTTQQLILRFNVMAFQFYDTAVKSILTRVTFRNITAPAVAMSFMDHSDHYLAQGLDATRGIRFENVSLSTRFTMPRCGSNGVCNTMSSRIQGMWDYDGTASETGRPSIIGTQKQWWEVGPDCVKDVNYKLYKCDLTNNRDIVFVSLRIPGLIDNAGCLLHTALNVSCNDQNAGYTTGTVTPFGKDSNFSLALSPWPGVAGISGNGWHFRPKLTVAPFITGAPSRFAVGATLQIPKSRFVVISMAYPAGTVFNVTMSEFSRPHFRSFPMSTKENVFTSTETLNDAALFNCTKVSNFDFCTNTGGPGIGAWHFDGTHFFLRVVSPACYTAGRRFLCQDGSRYEVDGASVPDIMNLYTFQVTADCPGCNSTTFNNLTYFQVPDSVPAAFPLEVGTLLPTLPPVRSTQRICNLNLPYPPSVSSTPVTTTSTTSGVTTSVSTTSIIATSAATSSVSTPVSTTLKTTVASTVVTTSNVGPSSTVAVETSSGPQNSNPAPTESNVASSNSDISTPIGVDLGGEVRNAAGTHLVPFISAVVVVVVTLM
jgi:hypothetical protein